MADYLDVLDFTKATVRGIAATVFPRCERSCSCQGAAQMS